MGRFAMGFGDPGCSSSRRNVSRGTVEHQKRKSVSEKHKDEKEKIVVEI